MDVRYELKQKEAREVQGSLSEKNDALVTNQFANYCLDAVFGVVSGLAVAHAYADVATLYFTPTPFILAVTSVPVFMTRLLGENRANELRAEVNDLEHKMQGLNKYLS